MVDYTPHSGTFEGPRVPIREEDQVGGFRKNNNMCRADRIALCIASIAKSACLTIQGYSRKSSIRHTAHSRAPESYRACFRKEWTISDIVPSM